MSTVLTPSLGTPTIGPRHRVLGGAKRAAEYDVGDGRRMTARQMARHSGVDLPTIYARLRRGVRGADLLLPKRAKRYDVGGGELLTIHQIMLRTDLSKAAIQSRLSRGVTGADLLRRERKDLAAPRSSTMVLACRLALAFPDRVPTTKQIRALRPMTPDAAERWQAAYRAALRATREKLA